MRQLLTNSAVVAAMLAVEFLLRGQGVTLPWRLAAMGAVSAVLLTAVTVWRRRRPG